MAPDQPDSQHQRRQASAQAQHPVVPRAAFHYPCRVAGSRQSQPCGALAALPSCFSSADACVHCQRACEGRLAVVPSSCSNCHRTACWRRRGKATLLTRGFWVVLRGGYDSTTVQQRPEWNGVRWVLQRRGPGGVAFSRTKNCFTK